MINRFTAIFLLGALFVVAGCVQGSVEKTEQLPEPVSVEINSSEFNLGQLKLADKAATQVTGLISWPKKNGPYPIALLAHGNHIICKDDPKEYGSWPCPVGSEVKNETGLNYLVEAVAKLGFIAVAPNLNVQYTYGAGEPLDGSRSAEIFERVIAGLNNGEFEVPASSVGNQIIGIGHSRGGQDLQLMAAKKVRNSINFAGLMMLMPALNVQDALPLSDLPTVVVIGSCDGDTGFSGGDYFTSALLEKRTSPVVLMIMERGTHNATNSLLSPERLREGPGCNRPLAAKAQRSILSETAPLILSTMIGKPTSHWTGRIFEQRTQIDGITTDVYQPNEKMLDIDNLKTSSPAVLTKCPIGYYTEFGQPGSKNCHRPELSDLVGYPKSVSVSWSNPNTVLYLREQLSSNEIIRIRAFVDVADERVKGKAVQMFVRAAGKEEKIRLSPSDVFTEFIDPFHVSHGMVLWQTFDINLKQNADQIEFEFDAPRQGSIQLVSVSLLADEKGR